AQFGDKPDKRPAYETDCADQSPDRNGLTNLSTVDLEALLRSQHGGYRLAHAPLSAARFPSRSLSLWNSFNAPKSAVPVPVPRPHLKAARHRSGADSSFQISLFAHAFPIWGRPNLEPPAFQLKYFAAYGRSRLLSYRLTRENLELFKTISTTSEKKAAKW